MFEILFLFLAITQAAVSTDGKCRVLALSGGGGNGAYEAGVLWGLIKNETNTSDYAYDVVSGVSAGSINSWVMSTFEKGNENDMVEWLSMVWQNLTNSQVYGMWPDGGIIQGLTNKSSIMDDSPLIKYLTNLQNEQGPIQRKLVIGAVDTNSGSYISFNETEQEMIKAIISSSSIPGTFPVQKWPNRNLALLDGGPTWETNTVSAINRCKDSGFDEKDIIFDIIGCDLPKVPKLKNSTNSWNAMINYNRFKSIKSYHKVVSDAFDVWQSFPNATFRHYVNPSEPLGGGDPISIANFDNHTAFNTGTYLSQLVGRKDGEQAKRIPQGYMFTQMKKWHDDKETRARYPVLSDYISIKYTESFDINKSPHPIYIDEVENMMIH